MPRLARFSSLLLTLSLLALALFAGSARAASPTSYVPGEVVVKLNFASDLPGVAATYALNPVPISQFGSVPIYRLAILDGTDPAVKAASMLADLRVVYADVDQIGAAPESRDISWAVGGGTPFGFVTQWAGPQINLPAALTVSTGANITVAVLDTGIDPTHPALAGHLLPGYDFVDGDADPTEVGIPGVNIAYGHGTHVAGLVAYTAPGAKIMPLRVLDPNGVGNAWVLVQALQYAMNPTNPANKPADVINLSLSTFADNRLVRDALGAVTCDEQVHVTGNLPCFRADGHGAVVVAAAGNSASTTAEYPAADPVHGILSVAASTPLDTLAPFSNSGSWVDVEAPGVGILSTVPGGQYAWWSGTSMATPLAAGEAALVRSVFPGLDANGVVQRIMTTSTRVNSQVQLRINAAAAVGAPILSVAPLLPFATTGSSTTTIPSFGPTRKGREGQ